MILWIARDKDWSLNLFNEKPKKEGKRWYGGIDEDGYYNGALEISKGLFPEVTFENSPQQVELSLLGKLDDKPILTNYTLAESKAMIGGLSEKYRKEVPKEYYGEIEVKEVITKIDTKKFKYFKSIEFDGKIYESFYNNNYFYNEVDNCLILEICNDDDTMYYYEVTEDDLIYLGLFEDVFGIFESENINNIVELNSSHC